MNTIDWRALDHKMGLVQQWIFQPLGAALLGVFITGYMIDALPGWQGPAFAMLLAVTITMVARLMSEKEAPVHEAR